MAVDISSVTSRVAFLNSLIPWPKPLASSGNFLAPNRIRTTAKIRTISQPPKNAANMIFIIANNAAFNLSPARIIVKPHFPRFLLVPVEVQMNHSPIHNQRCSGNFLPFETMILSTPDYAVNMFDARP